MRGSSINLNIHHSKVPSSDDIFLFNLSKFLTLNIFILRDFHGYADKVETGKKIIRDVWKKGDSCFR